jgi:hypothetical protein
MRERGGGKGERKEKRVPSLSWKGEGSLEKREKQLARCFLTLMFSPSPMERREQKGHEKHSKGKLQFHHFKANKQSSTHLSITITH